MTDLSNSGHDQTAPRPARNRFHKLGNNTSNFPHLDTVNTYKFDNDFNYERFNATQMSLQVCTVPWDMGEAHVGNRTITGIGNVVHFGSPQARDEYFDQISDADCFRFETKYKELHREKTIEVPLPYDIAARHNYLRVQYNLLANDQSLINYETPLGVRDWFWFIREVEFISPSTTRLHLLEDAWQTWIYDVDITGMIIERSHAPMLRVTADEYLENPIENCEHLLTADVDFGEPTQVAHTSAHVFCDEHVFACVATTADVFASWGTAHAPGWCVPAASHIDISGVPSTYVFAMDAGALNHFLDYVDTTIPQFKQTIQAIFFADYDLLTFHSAFTFADTTCYRIDASNRIFDHLTLSKEQFGYDQKYANIAKLYTHPYAMLVTSDENGNTSSLKIENTSGKIRISAAMSIAYPAVKLRAHLLGVGRGEQVLTFANMSSKSLRIGGNWYETIRAWDVPTFAVVISPAQAYDYSTYFDRAQAQNEYNRDYDNAIAQAGTDLANTKAIAATQQTNTNSQASTDNSNTQATAATQQTNTNTAAAADNTNAQTIATAARDAVLTTSTATNTNAENEADNAELITNASNLVKYQTFQETRKYNDALLKNTNAVVAATVIEEAKREAINFGTTTIQGMSSAGISAVEGFFSGGPAGAVGGGITGGLSALTNQISAGISLLANVHLMAREAEITQNSNTTVESQTNITDGEKLELLNAFDRDVTKYNTSQAKASTKVATDADNANAQRTRSAAITAAANTYAADVGNAQRLKDVTVSTSQATYTTAVANAQRLKTVTDSTAQATYDTLAGIAEKNRTVAKAAITNSIAQAALDAPQVAGMWANVDNSVTAPMSIMTSIVTQSKSAIAAAGDHFLRFGYAYDRYWQFDGNWTPGKYFTYWKLSDFWVSGLSVPDLYMDRLRFFLFGGVTVWKNPADIAKVSIYDNFK